MDSHFLIGVLLLAALAGCDRGPSRPSNVIDQCMRQVLFDRCLAAVPKGPERIGTSNDWDEVVSECGSQARVMSIRSETAVAPECVYDGR